MDCLIRRLVVGLIYQYILAIRVTRLTVSVLDAALEPPQAIATAVTATTPSTTAATCTIDKINSNTPEHRKVTVRLGNIHGIDDIDGIDGIVIILLLYSS